MFPDIPHGFVWPEPWEPLNEATDASRSESFVRELTKELGRDHPLYGVPALAVANRSCSDDVLFATADPARPFAVVHLTWTGRAEESPIWPATTAFRNWDEWVERGLVPDCREYADRGRDEPAP